MDWTYDVVAEQQTNSVGPRQLPEDPGAGDGGEHVEGHDYGSRVLEVRGEEAAGEDVYELEEALRDAEEGRVERVVDEALDDELAELLRAVSTSLLRLCKEAVL